MILVVFRRLLIVVAIAALLWVGVAGIAHWLAGRAIEPQQSDALALNVPDEPAPFAPPSLPPAPSQGFAGSQVCAECHADISESFHGHPMGRSLAKVNEASPLETYGEPTRFELPRAPDYRLDRSYFVERSNGDVLHHEVVTTREGEPLYDLAVPVHYAVGSGKRGRSYLVNRDGLLFMSPLTWYSSEGRWDLSPGYQLKNLHFGRRVIDGCVNCHAGRVAGIDGVPNRFAPVPFHEESIGCERCHGPAQAHVNYWNEGGSESEPDPLQKLGELTSQQRDHICFQCHLIGEHRLTRYGRTEFDFRPGDLVTDIWTLFVKRDAGIDQDQTTRAVSQVEQMLSSVCYQRSDGALGCVSCHDPHSTPPEEDRLSFYRDRCLHCHSPSATQCSKPLEQRQEVTPEDSCVQCHMPPIAANDVPHTSQTDHRVLREIFEAPPSGPSEDVELHVFGAEGGAIPEPELERASALAMVKHAESTNNSVLAVDAIPLLERWLKVVPNDIEALESLGMAHFLVQDFPSAAAVWERGLEGDPDHEQLLRRLFMLCHEAELTEQGVEYGRRLTAVNAWDYEYFGRLAHMLGQLNRLDEGIAAALRALEINPAAYEIHAWLADAYAALGNTEQSQHHRSLYETFAP